MLDLIGGRGPNADSSIGRANGTDWADRVAIQGCIIMASGHCHREGRSAGGCSDGVAECTGASRTSS